MPKEISYTPPDAYKGDFEDIDILHDEQRMDKKEAIDIDENLKPSNPFESMRPETFAELVEAIRSCEGKDIPTEAYCKLRSDLESGNLSEDYGKSVSRNPEPSIECSGIDENREQFFKNFIKDTFSDKILSSALIDKIDLSFDSVLVYLPKENPFGIDGGRHYIPSETFQKFWEQFDDKQRKWFSAHINRGESIANWFSAGVSEGKYFSSPIIISNQDYDKSNLALLAGEDPKDIGLEYLSDLPNYSRRKFYIAGSIAHEVAHNVYNNMINDKEHESEWKQLVDQIGGNITSYAGLYEEKNGERDYDENFAEAVRIYTTIPGYFDNGNLSPIKEFLRKYFPQIQEKMPLMDVAANERAALRKALEKGVDIGDVSSGIPYEVPETKLSSGIRIGPDGTIYRGEQTDQQRQTDEAYKIKEFRDQITKTEE